MDHLCALLWNAFVLGGAVFLVIEKGRSGWWVVLALVLLTNATSVRRVTGRKP